MVLVENLLEVQWKFPQELIEAICSCAMCTTRCQSICVLCKFSFFPLFRNEKKGENCESQMNENVNSPISKLAENKCPNYFTDAMQCKCICFIHIFGTHPILLRHNRAFIPLLIKIMNITIYTKRKCQRKYV